MKVFLSSVKPHNEQRPGRPPLIPDDRLVEEITAVSRHTKSLGFHGDGYRKVWAMLRSKGVCTSMEKAA